MKKFISILCVMAFAVSLLALAGCGGSKEIPADSQYIGTWKAVRAELMGEKAEMSEVLDGDWIITLKADGTAEQQSSDESGAGVWSITKNGIKVKLDDAKSAMKFTYENNELSSKLVATFFFEKQS